MTDYKIGDWVKGELKSTYTAHLPPSYAEGIITWIAPSGTLHVLDSSRMRTLIVGPKHVVDHMPLLKQED